MAFGLIRGLAVLLGRRVTDSVALRSFHRRFEELAPRSAQLMSLVQLAVVVSILGTLWWPGGLLAVPVALALVVARRASTRLRQGRLASPAR
jgi:hypothetical protein